MSVRTTINPVVRMLVLIVCEHMSTAQEEYRMVWKRKLSLPTALFLINRYVLLFIAVIYPLSTLLWWRDDFVSDHLGLCDATDLLRPVLEVRCAQITLAVYAWIHPSFSAAA